MPEGSAVETVPQGLWATVSGLPGDAGRQPGRGPPELGISTAQRLTQLPLKSAESRLLPSCSPGTSRAIRRPQCRARVASPWVMCLHHMEPTMELRVTQSHSAAQSSPRWASS